MIRLPRGAVLLIAGALGGAGVALQAVLLASPVGAGSGTMVCSDNPCLVSSANNGADGLRVTGSQGPLLDHTFIVNDWQGNPQFFTDVGSVDTGDLPFCVTSADLSRRVCLNPGMFDATKDQFLGSGFVTIYDSSGHSFRLTITDLVWLHRHE